MLEDIKKLQEYLKDNSIDAYIISSNDDHGSEYIGDHFKARAYFSSFTGSAGTLVVTQEASYVWTDGRYFLQAEAQLKKSGSILMKMGLSETPSIPSFLSSLGENKVIAFDFKLVPTSFATSIKKTCPSDTLIDESEIINKIWLTRPSKKKSKAYYLSDEISGESVNSKINFLLNDLKEKNADGILVTSLDDIAYLTNTRGDDISFNPVNYSFFYLSNNKRILYMDKEKYDEKFLSTMNSFGIEIKDYESVYEDIKNEEGTILLDEGKTNFALFNLVKHGKLERFSALTMKKTIKNPTEIKNIKKAHVEDAVAMVKFMHYIKTNFNKVDLDELKVQEALLNFRKEGKDFLDLSFGTICGFNSHGAIIHYSSSEETNIPVNGAGLLLVDSGAQYKYGTTDITRTFALGKITKEMKHYFTLVLKSHIDLAKTTFLEGTPGLSLDMISRAPMYQDYVDYRHGTGHGVGYLLNVHEGPQSITCRAITPMSSYPFKENMLTSNEPGIYLENKFGIRHENLVLTYKKEENEWGKFLGLETITLVPFDLDGIDKKMLDESEKKWLNNYHKLVYKKLNKYLTPELRAYLKKVTKAI